MSQICTHIFRRNRMLFLLIGRFAHQINSSSVDITPPPGTRPGMTSRYNPESNVEYRNCKKLGEEIRQVLTQVRRAVREKIEQAAAPKAAVTCPCCGATTTPDASGCCEYCGGAVNG